MTTPKIHVETRTVVGQSGQPLISVFEGNMDLDVVEVNRQEFAVKSILPFEFIILVTTTYMLEKFILEPLLNPIAEKFDWKKAVKKYRNPYQPFNVIIKLAEESIEIKTDPQLIEDEHIKNIWNYIQLAIKILKENHLYDKVKKIRLVSNEASSLLVICHETARPAYILDINNQTVKAILPANADEYRELTFEEAADLKSRQYVERLHELNDKKTDE